MSIVSCEECNQSWDGYCPLCKGDQCGYRTKLSYSNLRRVSGSELIIGGSISPHLATLPYPREFPERVDPNQSFKDFVIRRDQECLRCGEKDKSKLSIDHIIPVSKGGSGHYYNLQTLCFKCNVWKSHKIIDYRGDFKGIGKYIEQIS